MQRFYIKDFKILEDKFTVRDTNIVYQLVKVLRTRIGDEVIIFNREDCIDYVCEIKDFSKKEIDLELLKEIKKDSEHNLEINLFQALPNKLDKIQYILQKGVEVGVSSFSFFRSERSQKLAVSEKKKERLERIIIEAVEQCGENKVPELDLECSVKAVDNLNNGESIFLHTQNNNSQSLQKYINSNLNKKIEIVNIFVGPEGGFSEDEVTHFEQKKFSRIHLGNRILRTETAGVVTAFTLRQML